MGNSKSVEGTNPPPSSDPSTEAKAEPVASASTTTKTSSVASQQSGSGNSQSVEGTKPPPSSDQSTEAKAKPVASASATTKTSSVASQQSGNGNSQSVEGTKPPPLPDQSTKAKGAASASTTTKRNSVASPHSGDGNSKSKKGRKPPPLPNQSTKAEAEAKAKAEAKSFLRKGRAPNKIQVFWRPPTIPFVKVNTDGVSKNNPGAAACGGVFRDFQGEFLGAFAMNLGRQSSFFAEIMGIIQGISYAAKRGWYFIWLESDSTAAIACLLNSNFNPPRRIKNDWLNCKASISKMSIQCTHIYREGNKVADIMANLGLCSSGSIWFNSAPLQIKDALYKDCSGVPNCRFITQL
ncbi:Ribonuclease H protein [Melia azedarach]|uniref:Ribonuclease H protein n=1 Tax=Melia azedarach TaxID=155640 RepID=A0ACC1XGG0_MELAZ|nr:Ribonuclease H protein [Melia azedarach]